MDVTYFGHSVILVKTGGSSILIDPFITDNGAAEGVTSVAEMNPDFILVTHAHADHFGDTPEIALASGAVVIANFEITSYLTNKFGYDNTFGMNTGGSASFAFGDVTVTYARHSSSFNDGAGGGNPNGFIIQSDGKVIYAAGDTAPFQEMEWIGNDYEIDIAFLPVGDRFTMGIRGCVRAAKMLRSKVTVAVHYNTFPEIEIDIGQWEATMRAAGLGTRVMRPGETIGL